MAAMQRHAPTNMATLHQQHQQRQPSFNDSSFPSLWPKTRPLTSFYNYPSIGHGMTMNPLAMAAAAAAAPLNGPFTTSVPSVAALNHAALRLQERQQQQQPYYELRPPLPSANSLYELAMYTDMMGRNHLGWGMTTTTPPDDAAAFRRVLEGLQHQANRNNHDDDDDDEM
jgi:hypothetical protein